MAHITDEEYLEYQRLFAIEKHRPQVDEINLHTLKEKILAQFPDQDVTCSIWGVGHCNMLVIECGNMVVAQVLGYDPTHNNQLPGQANLLSGIAQAITDVKERK